MRSLADLISTLALSGSRLRTVSAKVSGVETEVPPDQARSRMVTSVDEFGLVLEGGRMLPFNCAGRFIFDGSPDGFTVKIGAAEVRYEIARGEA